MLPSGSGWSAEGPGELTSLLDTTGLPFLATPGGKGVVSDEHPQNVAPARSLYVIFIKWNCSAMIVVQCSALKGADLIVLVGARLNWILHFGRPPRFDDKVAVIQVGRSVED